MKLPIKDKYFDDIKKGKKIAEYRDAHITFVNEKTGESMRAEVISADVQEGLKDKFPDVLEDDKTIVFMLRPSLEEPNPELDLINNTRYRIVIQCVEHGYTHLAQVRVNAKNHKVILGKIKAALHRERFAAGA